MLLDNIAKLMRGVVTFKSEGGISAKFFNLCADAGIKLRKVRATKLGFIAKLPAGQYRLLIPIARKAGCRVRLLRKRGAAFVLYKMRRRYGIAAGAAILALLLPLMQGIVWHIEFYNMSAQHVALVRAQLQEYGIAEGSVANDEALQNVEQRILMAGDAFSWISFNFSQGKLVVEASVAVPKPTIEADGYTDIIAKYDGQIMDMQVFGGKAAKFAGEYVAKGEVIVSGRTVNARNGAIVDGHANAVVKAYVQKQYTYDMGYMYSAVVPIGTPKEYYSLTALNKTLNFSKNLAIPANAGVKTTYKPASFFGLPIPATLAVTSVQSYESSIIRLSNEVAVSKAQSEIDTQIYFDFAGAELLDKTTAVTYGDYGVHLVCDVLVLCDIGESAAGAML